MSGDSTWFKTVHGRFREVFGAPDMTIGNDDHWSLKPAGPYRSSINILVNGTDAGPVVWIFDPHSPNDGVLHSVVKTERDLDKTLEQIKHRLKCAAAMRK